MSAEVVANRRSSLEQSPSLDQATKSGSAVVLPSAAVEKEATPAVSDDVLV